MRPHVLTARTTEAAHGREAVWRDPEPYRRKTVD
jgi:hypothetical protein